jgi:aminoglycoside phosphotransferase family enzyme/predicted kinase
MVTEDQTAVIDFMASPSTHAGGSVERIDTHSAAIFLTASRAWKLKRAVRFDYLDFSTRDRRRRMCEAEVQLNRRTAPTLYRGVVPITQASDGTLSLGGPGEAIDWLVEMNRFDEGLLLDRLADSGRLEVPLMRSLALAVANLHREATPRATNGGSAGMRRVIDGNASGFAEFGQTCLHPSSCRSLTEASLREVGLRTPLLEARRLSGRVRQCHGDLHLRNIVLLDSQPTLFDAVEFNDDIACIDVLYDLAFLLMDLWRRGLPRHANTVWNGYLANTDESWDGLSALPLFLSCRAAVRAKTSATAAAMQSRNEVASALRTAAAEYLELAHDLLRPPPSCVVAVGGFSGAGKSTVAFGLAPCVGAVPGAVILRSDEIRKRLCGVAPLDRLGAASYTAEVSHEVYAAAARNAGHIARAGHGVVVDAVFAREKERAAVEEAAATAGVPFVGLWLDAPPEMLIERTERRRDDVSDATDEVVRNQVRYGAGDLSWARVDASCDPETTLRQAIDCVHARAASAIRQGTPIGM